MSQMPIIDFDSHFADFTSQWMKDHRGKYKTYQEMEDDLPQIYTVFLNTRAKWLGSISPGSYFTQFEDPKVLVDWMKAYCEQGVPVPDLLMEQIAFVGKPCEKRLLELLKDEDAPDEARMTAVGLLREMGSTLPKMLYINWQLNRPDKNELFDNAVESLQEMGASVVQPILQVIHQANDAGQEVLLDVLSRFPGNDQILKIAMRLFRDHPEKRALYAGYLAKIGDDSILPELIEASKEDRITYLTYIELRNAIETLGGLCPERTFEDDPEYEALRRMDLT